MMIQIVDDEKPKLMVELRKRISAYKRLHPNLTSQQIAKKIGISNSTFNRIENFDLKKPSFDHVIKILRFLGTDNDLLDFLKVNYPDIVDGLMEYLEKKRQRQDEADVDMLKMMADPEDGKILRYVKAKEYKVTRREIQDEFGRQGINGLDRLQEKGYVFYKDGFYHSLSGFRIYSKSQLKKIAVRELDESYSPNSVDKTINELTYTTRCVNPAIVLPKLKDLTTEYKHKIECILSDKDNHGDTPIWLILAFDTMLESNLFQSNETNSDGKALQ